jgi:hypothetical protein
MHAAAVRLVLIAAVMTASVACGPTKVPNADGGRTSGPSSGAREGVASGGGLCALVVRFRGHDYEGLSVRVAPRHGRELGTGVIPACNDTNESNGHPEHIAIQLLPGVAPGTAVVVRGWNNSVLVRDDVEEYPPPVQRLTEPVTCRPADEPVMFRGQWTGIIQPNGETELDLVPPYHVDVTVRQASHERYERAFVTVVVPPSLGTPLDRDDVRTSLWKGGDLSVRVHCGSKGAYVAERVEAFPPS